MKRGIILFFSFLFSCLLNAQLSIQQDTIRYVMVNLNLREAPNTTSAIITQIPKGTQVTIDEDCECKWIPVNYNGYIGSVSYTHLRAHETGRNLVCRLLLEKKKKKTNKITLSMKHKKKLCRKKIKYT